MRRTLCSRKLPWLWSALIILFGAPVTFAETKTNNLPKVPQTGTPRTETSPGGTRDGFNSVQTCDPQKPLAAYLLGEKLRESTISAYPTFWFYIPYDRADINKLEFTLAKSATKEVVYQTPVALSDRSGIVGITIPQKPEYALEKNTNYSWKLDIECNYLTSASSIQDVKVSNTSLSLTGWLRRLPITSCLHRKLLDASIPAYNAYQEHEIFYDALTTLAQEKQLAPNNKRVQKAWQQLLIDLGWQELIEQPIDY